MEPLDAPVWGDVPLPPAIEEAALGLAAVLATAGPVASGAAALNVVELQAWLDAGAPAALALRAGFATGGEAALAQRLEADAVAGFPDAFAAALEVTAGDVTGALLALRNLAGPLAAAGRATFADLAPLAGEALAAALLAYVAGVKGPARIAEDALQADPAVVGPLGAGLPLHGLLGRTCLVDAEEARQAVEAYFQTRLARVADEAGRLALSRQRAAVFGAAAAPLPTEALAAARARGRGLGEALARQVPLA